jgi:hypothetical protein
MAEVATCADQRWNKVRVEPALNGGHGLHLDLVEGYPVHIPTYLFLSHTHKPSKRHLYHTPPIFFLVYSFS